MRRLTREDVSFLLYYLSILLCGTCLGFSLHEVAPWLDTWVIIVTIAMLISALYLGRNVRSNVQGAFRDLAQARQSVQGLTDEMHKAAEEFYADGTGVPPSMTGVVVGHVMIVPIAGDRSEGSVTVMVKERCPEGHWHDLNEAGPVAVVLTEIANELRHRAMKAADDD